MKAMNSEKIPAVLVTGSAIRLGKEMILSLARLGHDVVIHYNHSAKEAEDTAELARKIGVSAYTVQADLEVFSSLPDLISQSIQHFPHLGILINSASTYYHASIMDTSPEFFEKQFNTNLRVPFFLTHAFARNCQQGLIINMIDNKKDFNQYQFAAYLLAKKSLAEFTKMAAMELAPRFRVNGIAPGVILPGVTRTDKYTKWRIEGIPLRQQGKPDHICQTLNYLIENEFVTGQILVVDGGESTQHIGRNFSTYESEQ